MKNNFFFILVISFLFFNSGAFAQNPGLKNDSTLEREEPAARSIITASKDENKISLDVKGMDVVDVLKILSTRAGMNIIIGKNVSGRVTLFLKDVDINDAFDIVILASELAYDKNGGIVSIMTVRDYELIYGRSFMDKKQLLNIQLKYAKAAALSQVLNQVKSNIGKIVVDEPTNMLIIIDLPEKLNEMNKMIRSLDLPLDTKIFSLNYAQADKLNTKLQEEITKGIGSIKIDERTNKIIVTDYPEKLAEISKIINAFDEKTAQVLIDAQIVEVNPKKDEFAMGVDWDYWVTKNVHLISALAAPGLTDVTAIPTKLTLGVAAGDAKVKPTKPGQYKSIVDALRYIGETKIISSPRIMVVNNQEARILVGKKEAYITSTLSQSGTGSTISSQTVNFVDVGIKLYVTPTINKDGFITLKVRPEISSSEPSEILSEDKKTQIPIVTTSETETTIMIKDGTTIMIAGLKQDKLNKAIKKIPLLGDIPWLGVLFSNKKEEKTKTELVIFITPHIVSGMEPLDYVSLTQDKDIGYIQSFAKEEHRHKVAVQGGSDFKDYQTAIVEKIRLEFISLKESKKDLKGEAIVSFVLKREGKLGSDPRVLSSTNNDLNEIAVKSVKQAAPFAEFPKSVEKNEEIFKITLSYE